jgi:hypothetical protein
LLDCDEKDDEADVVLKPDDDDDVDIDWLVDWTEVVIEESADDDPLEVADWLEAEILLVVVIELLPLPEYVTFSNEYGDSAP